MPEAVIVDAIRTPIGRAVKGSLKTVRADDLAAIPLKALIERNPGLDQSTIGDVMMGCGYGEGESGYNIGRIASLLAGIDHHVPRVHGQPLLRLLATDDADGLPCDQGRARATRTSPQASRRCSRAGGGASSSSTTRSMALRGRCTTCTSRWA